MAASETVRVADRASASALVREVQGAMDALEALLAAESEQVRAGRLREGLARAEAKADLAAVYLRSLERAKANAVALARLAPEGVASLRAAHRRFMEAVETNQAVLATARTVSEGLIRSLASDIGKARVASVYGAHASTPSPYGRGPQSAPLVLSRSL